MPDGSLVEGHHRAAWPFELWQRMEENRTLVSRRPPRYKKQHIAPLQGLLVCRHCQRPIKYVEQRTSKTLASGVKRSYPAAYYRCYEYLRPCTAFTGQRHGVMIREHIIEGQFGILLDLFGVWLEPAIDAIRHEYAALGGHEVDEILEYEAKKAGFAQRRQKISDMYEMSEITRSDYLERMQRLRKEEMALPVPMIRSGGFSQRLVTAQEIFSLALQWHETSSRPDLRRKIAHSLIAPNGLIYNTKLVRVVGIRPMPDVYDVVKRMLEREGWQEIEPGLLWHDHYEIVPPPIRRTRYYDIVDALRDANHPLVSWEIADRVGISVSNTNLLLKTLTKAGVVRCSEYRHGSHSWREYEHAGRDVPIKTGKYRSPKRRTSRHSA